MPYRQVFSWERLDRVILDHYNRVSDGDIQGILYENPTLPTDTLPYFPADGFTLYLPEPIPTYETSAPDAALQAEYNLLS